MALTDNPVEGIDGSPCPRCELGTLSATWLHDGDLTKSGPVAKAVCNLCEAELNAHYHRAREAMHPTGTFATSWRDRLYAWLCNDAFAWIATEEYKRLVMSLVRYGMDAAARDHSEGREPPEHWSVYADETGGKW